jgi:hypothetical protein
MENMILLRPKRRSARLRDKAFKGRRPLMALVLGCVGCSSWPEQTPSKIGAAKYETMSCEELQTESKRLLTAAMDHPTHLSSQEQDQRENDLALINRDMDTLNKAWTANKCAQ